MVGQDIKSKIEEICSNLHSLYPNGSEGLHHNNDYELFVSIILASQTRDKVTNEVVRNFPYKSFKDLANADRCNVINNIRRVGFPKQKSLYLIEGAKRIINNFGGRLPLSYDELISLPGIGDKAACYILWQKGIETRLVLDTHMRRVLHRLFGFDTKYDLHKLESILSEEQIDCLNRTVVQFGREICKSRLPKCNVCPLKHLCHFYKLQGGN